MIVTNRTETFYKVEMTGEQAHEICMFLESMQDRHALEISGFAGAKTDLEKERMIGAVHDLMESLKDR